MSIGLLGQKIGMTSVYDASGRLHPVTVIAAGDNVLLRRLTSENDGYPAVQVGFDSQKESRVTKQLLGEFKKANTEPKRFIREFRLASDLPGGEINLSVTQFQAGDYVDVTGRSKGKGFQGVMKKHNFHGQGAAHGSKTHRRSGAIGNRSTPGRIWKNMGMPGHLGDERVTVQNLQVMQVREAEKIILVSGAVPGSNGSYVVVRPAIKKRSVAATPPSRSVSSKGSFGGEGAAATNKTNAKGLTKAAVAPSSHSAPKASFGGEGAAATKR